MMAFFDHGRAAVLLLALTQSFVLGSLDSEKNKSASSIETISRYLRLPLSDGIEWLAHSSEHPDGEEIQKFVRGVESGETWTLQILDTLWEEQTQILEKNTNSTGIYDQCARTNPVTQDENCLDFVGANLKCTASNASCEDRDFPSADRDQTTSYKAQDGLTVNDTTCKRLIESEDFTVLEICTITIFATIGVFLLSCTICDFVRRNRPADQSATLNTLAQFSLYTNAVALLVQRPTAETMAAIHGIRCLCCFLVIHVHRYIVTAAAVRTRYTLLEVFRRKDSWFAMYIVSTTFAVDTFCVIGGFLAAYIFLKLKKSGVKFNVLTMYLYRYLRITPCLAVLLLFVVVLFPRFGNGATWETAKSLLVDPCREKWWINLLYLQNIVAPDPICMVHSWYLALDMQLFWFSPLILYPLHRKPKIGLWLLGVFFVIALVTPAYILAVNGYSNVVLRLDTDLSLNSRNLVFNLLPTYNRASPYLIGIFLGYDVSTRKRHLSQVNVVINWFLCGASALSCTWALHRVYNTNFAYDLNMEIAFALLLRPTWSIASAWLVYACTQGYGGIATKFLSLPIFLPLSRLSYCIYLVHLVVQGIHITPSEYPVTFLSSPLFDGIFGDLVLSTAVAFVLNLFIERPSIVVTKILLANKLRQPELATMGTVEESKKRL